MIGGKVALEARVTGKMPLKASVGGKRLWYNWWEGGIRGRGNWEEASHKQKFFFKIFT